MEMLIVVLNLPFAYIVLGLLPLVLLVHLVLLLHCPHSLIGKWYAPKRRHTLVDWQSVSPLLLLHPRPDERNGGEVLQSTSSQSRTPCRSSANLLSHELLVEPLLHVCLSSEATVCRGRETGGGQVSLTFFPSPHSFLSRHLHTAVTAVPPSRDFSSARSQFHCDFFYFFRSFSRRKSHRGAVNTAC